MPARPDRPPESYPSNPWPLLGVLAVVGVGVAYAAFGHWRRAALMVAGALLVGALLRLVLSTRMSGLLAVRRRWFDVLVMGVMGLAITVVALVVPPSR